MYNYLDIFTAFLDNPSIKYTTRKVITNFNTITQYEDTLFNGAEQNVGFEVINGSMRIEIDKAGNLVYRTIADESKAEA